MKKILIITALVLFIIISLGCQNMKQDTKKAQEMSENQTLMDSQKQNIELYLKYNYKDIENVTLTDAEDTPMGKLINGYVNDNTELFFTATISGDTFDNGIGLSGELGDLAKYDKDKSVTEIKDEQNKK